MYSPTDGNAYVGGFSIKNQIDIVQLQIGVCPQFDILWENLTVEEHVLFYARIKGVRPEDENKMVEKAISEVKLTD